MLDTQLTRRWTLWVDGREREITARADFLVERGGRRFVADAKTGEQAKVTGRATRRQLLEYRHAYAVDGVLLVDAEAGRIVEVGFGLMARPTPSRLRPMLLVAALAFAAGAAAATWLLRG
ncbi:MAG TPA: hypothetical protein RMG45_22390 [Polyangiaceae bacterium LLY-WYZ-15_(1-7)]|nr:hypothetical protein [Polyangiaceae bacterium LLY-WYZ-15_(1-7)]